MIQQEAKLQWTQTMNLGIPGMDEEHQQFFSRIDDLGAAIARQGNPHDIERCLQVIVQEARAHFDHENQRFVELGYPNAARHAAAHARLAAQLWDALRTCYATQPGDDWMKKSFLIKQMLLDHFQLEDLKYRDFVRLLEKKKSHLI
jgi:hemerythrin-like metal-binding protein